MTVLIAGAGLGGSRTAEALRAGGYEGRIVVAGEEPHAPYERPALSKELLAGVRDPHDVLLRPWSHWDASGIELVVGARVKAVDVHRRAALVGDRVLTWDALVLATGARPRRLEGPPGVHHLRTLGDALTLAGELRAGTRLAVVGAGFIGAEVASTAQSLDVDVTLVDGAPLPLARVVGDDVGRLLADRYRAHGARLRLGAGVAGFRAGADGRLGAVALADGTEVAADTAVVGIGVKPAGDLLGGGPVETDACGRTRLRGVYACGDVAAWWRPSLGRHARVEHWTSAAGQAQAVARSILGEPEPYDETPYFWSDQFGLRLQHVGHGDGWTRTEIEGDGDSFVARYLRADGSLAGVLAANRPREIGALRRELAA